jgi:thiamine pyrophosphate-dependent acetolactate synthase large subunit-like protein
VFSLQTGKISGADLFVQSLIENKVTHFFNLPGHGMWPLVDSIYQHRDKISYVSGLNETNVALIAEGYAHASRRPSLVNVYHSSGTTLAMVALSVAWADHIPLIFSTTTNGRETSSRDQYAAVPRSIIELTSQYTKWSFEVPSAQRIPEAIKRAVIVASTPPLGPVHLSFPMDLYKEVVDDAQVSSRRHLPEVFFSGAEQIGIEKAATSLSKASLPLILSGSEVGQLDALDDLVSLSEMLNAPVITENGTPAYLPFPFSHQLHVGKLNDNLGMLQKADVILFVGFEATEGGVWSSEYPFRSSKKLFIQVTSHGGEICKQYTPDIALIGSPKIILRQLVLAAEKQIHSGRGISKWENVSGGVTRNTHIVLNDMCAAMKDFGGDVIECLLDSLKNEFGSKLTIVDHANSAHPYMESVSLRSKDDYFSISQKASAQGWGLPAGIGIQLALPNRRVLLMIGDGGFMFTSSALYSAAKHKVPLIVLVLNNGGYDAGKYYLRVENGTKGEFFLGDFNNPAISPAMLSESLGVPSCKLTSKNDVVTAMEKFHSSKGPFLFEVVLAPGFTDSWSLHWKSAGGMLP